MRAELVLQAAQRLEHVIRRFAEHDGAAFGRIAQLLGAAAHLVIVLHRATSARSFATDFLSLRKRRRTRCGITTMARSPPFASAPAVQASVSVSSQRRVGSESSARTIRDACPATLALEQRAQRLGRRALALGQPRAVMRKLAQLHVQVTRCAEAAQDALVGCARGPATRAAGA